MSGLMVHLRVMWDAGSGPMGRYDPFMTKGTYSHSDDLFIYAMPEDIYYIFIDLLLEGNHKNNGFFFLLF